MSINRRTKKFRRNQDQFKTKRLNRLRQQADAQTTFDSTHGGGIIQNVYGQHRRVGTPGSGGLEVVRFQIFSSDCLNSQATVEILARPPGKSTVEGEMTDIEAGIDEELANQNDSCGNRRKFLVVHDKLGAFLNEPDFALVGRLGTAIRMTEQCPDEYEDATKWEILTLAEQQTECEL